MNQQKENDARRLRRRFRVRKTLRLVEGRPRLSVFRSHRNMYVQIIDDFEGKTLVAASTQDGDVKGAVKFGGNKDAAAAVGKLVAQRALAKGISTVCFDRGDYKYHGRVAALADAAREAGLQF